MGAAELEPAEQLDRIRLARTPRIGAVGFATLLRRHRSATAAIAILPELARQAGAEPPRVPERGEAERELDRLHRLGGRMLFLGGPLYPPLLAQIADPPPLLAVLGDPRALGRRAIGLVGGRNASANGQRMAEALATELAAAGLVVVSGLARGIDTAAHRGAMFVGTTVACVAGGLDMPYPPENACLQEEIAAKGAVVSEAPPGTAPMSRHFPRRNRIIAGLSLGLVVVEAAPRSGSLITARFAEEAGRMLFAVPGSPLDPRSRGSNALIREGAVLTEQASDVLAGLARYAAELLPPEWDPGQDGTGPEGGRAGFGEGGGFEEGGGFGEAGGPEHGGVAAGPAWAAGPAGAGWAEPDGLWDGPEPEADMPAARSAVTALLDASPTPVDEVVRRCHFSASVVAAALLDLELAGLVETLPGNRVCLLSDPGR